ncbi:MAG: iron-sulfur cluster assembly accessory protein [Sulfobacillus sp.]|nr:iron-sulfur cluster assembly accessory protein [Sulfobacillus sp.]
MAIRLEITPDAHEAFLRLEPTREGDYIRVQVGPSCGCGKTGFQMIWESRKKWGDTVIRHTPIPLVLDRQARAALEGATIDYSADPVKHGFRIEAPEARASCGCGHS